MLFFTQKGKCFWMRVFEIPEEVNCLKEEQYKNLINIEPDDKVKAFICTQDLKEEAYINSHYVIMCTKGQVKKLLLNNIPDPDQMG